MKDLRQHSWNKQGVERETLEVDVCLVGGGAANLACAIAMAREFQRLGQADKTILVLEKAEDLGYHTLSGAVMNPRAVQELSCLFHECWRRSFIVPGG